MDDIFNKAAENNIPEPQGFEKSAEGEQNISAPQPEKAPEVEEPVQQTTSEPETAPQSEPLKTAAPTFSGREYSSVYNEVNYTPVKDEEVVSNRKGLKVFALIMALVILLTGSCLAGYFVGKNGITLTGKSVIDLAARPTDTDELTPAQVYKKVSPSVVGIAIYDSEGKGGNATGIVLSANGYIVTNDHIYSEIVNPKFKVFTSDGKEYEAKYIGGDLISDVAVLKVDGAQFTPATFGNSDELYCGQNVVAIGNPNGAMMPSSVTEGIISATDYRITGSSNYSTKAIQTTSAINPGSSGGALVDMYGHIIGVTYLKTASSAYDNVGFAIPTTVMKRVADELISDGKVVSRAKLGITYQEITSIIAEIKGYNHVGILIASVSEDSGLYGIAKEGDFITHINGQEIVNSSVVLDIVENSKAGDIITLTIISESGATRTVQAELKANPGQSSYKTSDNSGSQNNNGIFDFPQGE